MVVDKSCNSVVAGSILAVALSPYDLSCWWNVYKTANNLKVI